MSTKPEIGVQVYPESLSPDQVRVLAIGKGLEPQKGEATVADKVRDNCRERCARLGGRACNLALEIEEHSSGYGEVSGSCEKCQAPSAAQTAVVAVIDLADSRLAAAEAVPIVQPEQ